MSQDSTVHQHSGERDRGAKSSVEEIRERFDQLVEKFSDLDAGQSTAVDGALMLDLIADAAACTNPDASRVLDVGCGAGNYTLKLLEQLPDFACTLVDLSRPMLDRAVERIEAKTEHTVEAVQGDVREVDLGSDRFDVVLAGAVLHHLRTDGEWRSVFAKLYRSLRPGGSLWIADLVDHRHPAVRKVVWDRYGRYLAELKDADYRDGVLAYIEQEDSPRPLLEQVDLLREVGFPVVEVLHKNNCFAAFGAVKED